MESSPWLVFALISPFFWAVVHVLDSYCVQVVFRRPWVGITTSALTTLAALPFFAYGLVLKGITPMSWGTVSLCIICGGLFMLSQLLYFKALALSESGIIAAYGNLIPLFLPMASFALQGEVLTVRKYIGIAILVSSSFAFCLLDANHKSRWAAFWMMFVGAWLQVAYFLIQKQIFNQCPVHQAFLVISLATVAAGLLPLLLHRGRVVFMGNWPSIRQAGGFLFAIEVANLIAIGTSQYAVSYGVPSLVAAVEASLPAYTFLLSLALFFFTKKLGEEQAKHRFKDKLRLVASMALGVGLVS